MRKPFVLISVLGVLIAIGAASAALAGYKGTYPVYVQPTFAYGAMGTARNSTDGTQYIGCSVSYTSDNGWWADCQAKNSAGDYFYCWTNDPVMAQVVLGNSEGAYLYMSRPAANQTRCDEIEVRHHSYHEPKK
jgi:hypothetical protein